MIRTASHRSRRRRFRFDDRDRLHFAACRYTSKTASCAKARCHTCHVLASESVFDSCQSYTSPPPVELMARAALAFAIVAAWLVKAGKRRGVYRGLSGTGGPRVLLLGGTCKTHLLRKWEKRGSSTMRDACCALSDSTNHHLRFRAQGLGSLFELFRNSFSFAT